ncbi:hypothetical protein [Alicyclobacillus dauci]|uniref:Uncharacterized protein n=1 Tax=Alicyclobacillus dauci TaxID=1475485 RepID=A0ABY6YXU6_9BACL|nr:hypothetical protein [Alicyclobacillus dauci]WAH35434.1 hypothetical protein NZD86_14125 [Alicyclobacillus dauci]
MRYTKETVHKFVGQWIHCHSVYGVHQGIVHRAMRDGFILVHHTRLADGRPMVDTDLDMGIYGPTDTSDIVQTQFLPAPGLFIPYGGVYGIWPRPFII